MSAENPAISRFPVPALADMPADIRERIEAARIQALAACPAL